MQIAVVGAGAIGSGIGALLARAGHEVVLVGRPDHVAAIRANGIRVEGCLGSFTVHPEAVQHLEQRPEVALLTTKTQDVAEAVRANREALMGAPVLAIQNGVRATDLVAEQLPGARVLSGVTFLHATYLTAGSVELTLLGWLVVGDLAGRRDAWVEGIARVLDAALPTRVSDNIRGAQWLKLIVNLNNALAAVTGLSIREMFADPRLTRLSVALMREGVRVADRAGIRLESLPDTSVARVRLGTRLPTVLAARVVAQKAHRIPYVGQPLASTLQSVKRGRPTEIDYLNGEVVSLGAQIGVPTPLNARAVELVREVERTRRFLTPTEVEALLRENT